MLPHVLVRDTLSVKVDDMPYDGVKYTALRDDPQTELRHCWEVEDGLEAYEPGEEPYDERPDVVAEVLEENDPRCAFLDADHVTHLGHTTDAELAEAYGRSPADTHASYQGKYLNSGLEDGYGAVIDTLASPHPGLAMATTHVLYMGEMPDDGDATAGVFTCEQTLDADDVAPELLHAGIVSFGTVMRPIPERGEVLGYEQAVDRRPLEAITEDPPDTASLYLDDFIEQVQVLAGHD